MLRSGNPQINPKKLKEARLRLGQGQEALAKACGVSVDTYKRWEAGTSVPFKANAGRLAEALGLRLESICYDATYQAVELSKSKYTTESLVRDWVLASNGLKYQVHKLRHNELGRYTRGKLYDFQSLPTKRQEECRTLVRRHPDVAYLLREHPNIITSLDAFDDLFESQFWIIDDWVEGPTLERVIARGPMEIEAALSILRGVAAALTELHKHNIILRELSPSSIIVRASDQQAILTEFELAKLLDHNATVSPEKWPEGSGYRAIDATSDDVDHRADIFSWGRIASEILLGHLPACGDEENELKAVKLPKRFQTFLLSTLAPFRDQRPSSFDSFLKAK